MARKEELFTGLTGDSMTSMCMREDTLIDPNQLIRRKQNKVGHSEYLTDV